MISRTVTSSTQLRYYLTTTDPTPHHKATLTLHVTNPTTTTIPLNGITFTYPPTDPNTLTATASHGWTITTTDPATSTYRATPTTSSIPPGTHLTFTLTGNHPTTQDATTINITDTPDHPPLSLPVRFWPTSGGTFEDFYADPPTVDREGTTTLHWKGGTDLGISYTLVYNTGGVDARTITVKDRDGKFQTVDDPNLPNTKDYTYTTENLEGLVVGYQLEAYWTDGTDQGTKDLATASLVNGGDLTAGNINSLTGSAQILTAGQQGFLNNTQYTAPTDGILYASTVTDRLWVQITPPGDVLDKYLAMPTTFHLITPEDHPSPRTFNRNLTIPVGKNSTLQFGIPDQDYTLTWQPLGSQQNGTGNLTDSVVAHFNTIPQLHTPTQKIIAGWPDDQKVEDFYVDQLTVPAGTTTNVRWHGPTNNPGSLFTYTLTYNTDSGDNKTPITLTNDDLQRYQSPDPNNTKLAYYKVPTQPLNGTAVGFNLTATYQTDPNPLPTHLTTAAIITGGDLTVGHISTTGSTAMLHTDQTATLNPDTTYTTTTDGFLYGSILGSNCSLITTITPPTGENPYTIKLTSADTDHTRLDNKNFTVPLRKSTTFTYTLVSNYKDYKLIWHPLGTTPLTQ